MKMRSLTKTETVKNQKNSGTREQNEMKNAIKSIDSRMEQATETICKGE